MLLPGAVSVLNDALRFLESAEGVFGNWDLLYAAHCGECLWWADALTASSTARLGGGLNEDEIGLADYAYNRSHDPGCTADYAEFRRRKGRVGTTVGTTKLPRTRQRDAASCGGDDFREILTGKTKINRYRHAW